MSVARDIAALPMRSLDTTHALLKTVPNHTGKQSLFHLSQTLYHQAVYTYKDQLTYSLELALDYGY